MSSFPGATKFFKTSNFIDGITKLYCFRARVHSSVVCFIVFSANPVRHSMSFVVPLLFGGLAKSVTFL